MNWCTDPVILVFVPGVEYGFLCVCVQCDVRVVGGMYLNIVVIVVCFVAIVMLSLLINVVHSCCNARWADFC